MPAAEQTICEGSFFTEKEKKFGDLECYLWNV